MPQALPLDGLVWVAGARVQVQLGWHSLARHWPRPQRARQELACTAHHCHLHAAHAAHAAQQLQSWAGQAQALLGEGCMPAPLQLCWVLREAAAHLQQVAGHPAALRC